MSSRRSFLLSFALLTGLFAAATPVAQVQAQAQGHNYIALGDSYAFGFTTEAMPSSTGDQGYVSLFADSLASRFGGVRPTVTNLAIPGETSTSFFTGAPTVFSNQAPYPNGLVDAPLREQARNDNYPDIPFPQFSAPGVTIAGNSQNAALQDRLSQIKASGETVDYITIQMGGNDILALFGQDAFTGLDPSLPQQSQILGGRFLNLRDRYISLLTSLADPASGAPGAQIFIVGYADPFVGLGSLNPLLGPDPSRPLSTQLTLQANSLLAGIAGSFGAKYVDIYTPFVGREIEYSYIADPARLTGGSPNFHPNAAGYAVISGQIAAAAGTAAPEPGTLALLALAAAVGVVSRATRRTPGSAPAVQAQKESRN